MGATLAALQSGSLSYKLVVAIEGYPYLLTDATAAQAIAAWAGTDWSQAITGLVMDLAQEQKIDPWNPLQGGGTATLYVPPDASDRFGVDVHCTAGGVETELAATLGRADTTISVKSAASFAASGDAYVGTETFTYSSKSTNSFLGVTRGKYSPFPAYGTGAPRFSHDHRVGFVDYATELAPVVSSLPRTWVGRWVGIWACRNVGGVLDVQAQAHLLFAGKITEIRDDPTTNSTVVLVRHALDVFRDTVIGRDQWHAEAIQGIRLIQGMRFRARDVSAGSALGANDLVVVPSGASGVDQVNEGYYSLDQIYTLLNTWLAAEIAASRLNGYKYAFDLVSVGSGFRTRLSWRTNGSSTAAVILILDLPPEVMTVIGIHPNASGSGPHFSTLFLTGQGGDANVIVGPDEPSAGVVFDVNTTGNVGDVRVAFQNDAGTFVDNWAAMPAAFKPNNNFGLQWGVFVLDGKNLFIGTKVGSEIHNCLTTNISLAGLDRSIVSSTYVPRTVGGNGGPIPIVQILVIEATAAGLLKYLAYNTGTSGYNHPTYDALGAGVGAALPGGILGAAFDASIDALPGATKSLLAVIEKPTKITGDEGLLSGDLIVRRAFPVWKSGGLRFTCWQTPSFSNAIATLDESNKARPAGNNVDLRAVTTLTDQWQRDIVKIEYNRDITQLVSGGAYAKVLTFEDRVAIDDQGGEGSVVTISARNTYGQYAATGAGIEELAPGFLATMPQFSRPIRLLRRSITPQFYEGYAPGDVVYVNDKFARDPGTGRRTIVARPGLIVRHKYNPGGPPVGGSGPARQMAGEVDIVFLDTNRIAAYAPSGRIDETANTAPFSVGYDSTGPRIRLKAHEYSESGEAADAANFVAGDKIVITEIDPTSTSGPFTWSRTILSVSGNDITLTSALSSPTWDATRKYQITYDHYAIAQSTQLVKSFQAYSGNAQIESLSPPDQYGLDGTVQTYTASVHTDVPELIADQSYGDGIARDVAMDRALTRLVNNLFDHKTRHVGPVLSATVITQTVYAGYRLVQIIPIYLTKEQGSTNTTRYLKVAPFYRSATGASVTVRVTLTTTLPTGTSLNDVVIQNTFYQASWTTTSTTFATGGEALFSITIKNPVDGMAFLLVELTQNAETWGLAQINEGERIYFP